MSRSGVSGCRVPHSCGFIAWGGTFEQSSNRFWVRRGFSLGSLKSTLKRGFSPWGMHCYTSPTMKADNFDPRVDAYINKSAAFAQPIIEHLRELVHKTVPDIE